MSYIYTTRSSIKPVSTMKKFLTVALVVGLFVIGGLNEAQAQVQIEVGPRLGFDLVGSVEEFFIGVDGRVDLAALPVALNGTVDIYLVGDNFDFWHLGIHALYEFGVATVAFDPYVGGGIGISRWSRDDDFFGNFPGDGDSDVGLNLIGGATFGFGNLKPFAQAQITFGDVDLFTIGGGLLFSIGN